MTTRSSPDHHHRLYYSSAVPVAFFLIITCCAEMGASGARLLGEAAGSTDRITSACQHTDYFDLCMSTLQSYPDAQKADAKGLALVSIKACIADAEETGLYVKQLRANNAAADEYAGRCLDDCATQYSDALDDLRESLEGLQRGDYETVNSMVSGAMTDAGTCEDGFSDRPGYASPLTERNDRFFKLCSNSLSIARLLA